MSQNAILLPTTGVISGLSEQGLINNAYDTLNTKWSGSSEPSGAGITLEVGQDWLDTSGANLTWNLYDGTDWLPTGVIDATNHVWTPPVGGGLIPTIASASTVDLGSVPQSRKYVSGTTTITSFGTSAIEGTQHYVKFLSALTITAGSDIVTLSGSNMSVSAGDETQWSYESAGGVWKCIAWSAAATLPSFANNRIMANVSGSTATPSAQTLSAVLDIGGATNGFIPYRSGGAWSNVSVSAVLDGGVGSTVGGLATRGTSTWGQVTPNTAGYVLTDNGTGTPPSFQAAPVGNYVQHASDYYTALSSGSNIIPFTTALPTTSNGQLGFSATITPKKSTNKLLVSVKVQMASSANNFCSFLTVGAGTNALAAAAGNNPGSAATISTLAYDYEMTAGTTSPLTFNVYYGSGSGTAYINGNGSGAIYGGALTSSIVITEVAA